MTAKRLPTTIVPPARRGSKQGWRPVVGDIPPEHYARLERLVRRDGKRRTDLVAEAIALLLKRKKVA